MSMVTSIRGNTSVNIGKNFSHEWSGRINMITPKSISEKRVYNSIGLKPGSIPRSTKDEGIVLVSYGMPNLKGHVL